VSIREIRAKKVFALIGISLLVAYALFRGWVNLGTWLAKADEPKTSEVIVCLSGVERIRKSADLYHEGLASQIILTVQTNKQALTGLGVPEERITPAPGPPTRRPWPWPLSCVKRVIAQFW
jgi:hypothetical protein